MNFKRFFLGVAVALCAFAGSAQAMTLSLSGGTADVLGGDFGFTGAPPTLIPGVTAITTYGARVGDATPGGPFGGIQLAGGPADLRFEFLGGDALFMNTFNFGGGPVEFTNNVTTAGDNFSVLGVANGFLDIVLGNGSGTAINNGLIGAGLSYAFFQESSTSFIMLFDDGGGGDNDLDDLAVRISVVPLPPAIWLFMSAIVGLVSFARVRRRRTQTA